jgi:hypothetical protein
MNKQAMPDPAPAPQTAIHIVPEAV